MHRKFAISLFVVIIAAVFAACGALLSFYRSIPFDPSLLSKNASTGRGTVFLDRHGRELRFLPDPKGERARWVRLKDIPEHVRNAFIAAEDERFYRHRGFDGFAIIRAAWSNLTKRKIVSGASTISQQVVRMADREFGVRSSMRGGKDETPYNINISNRRTYRDKLIEIVRSVKMERALSKDEILEQYLNRAPMGNNLVGVETAARAYFGTPVKNLSASEAAILASLPKAPGMFNPYGNGLARLIERRNWVLGRMDALGLLSHEQHLLAREDQPRLRKLNFTSAAPHLVDMLMKQGVTGGSVRTTIDLDIQTRVQEILSSHAERLRYRGAGQAAAIVIHNPTMETLAAAGSVEYSENDGGFNNGALALRSAGSTLKPFLYALAVESGETAATLLEDMERKYRSREGQYSPLNYDRKEYGPVKMRSALGSSLNLSAVKMLERVGEERFYDLLLRLNLINHPERGPEHYGLGMAIGNPEVSLEQLAAAYAALANYGIYRNVKYMSGTKEPEFRKVRTEERGQKMYERYVFLPQTAYIVTDILSDTTARSLTFNRSRHMMDAPFSVAIKTGTSTYFRDLWAVGFTPDYTVAVWAGNFDGSPTKKLSGSTAAAPIFSDIMNSLYQHSEPVRFKRPTGVRRMAVCGYSGMRPTEHCEHVVEELFIAGTEPVEACTFHLRNAKRHELAAPFAGWLYDKNRTGSAGRFRLSGFSDDLDKVFHDPWEGVAAAHEQPGVRARNNIAIKTAEPFVQALPQKTRYSIGAEAPGDAAGSAGPGGNGEIKIAYPLDRDRFVIDRFDREQVIKLQAVVARPAAYVEWFVNGELYKRTGPPFQAYWPLKAGRYTITAVDPMNVGDSVQVTVE